MNEPSRVVRKEAADTAWPPNTGIRSRMLCQRRKVRDILQRTNGLARGYRPCSIASTSAVLGRRQAGASRSSEQRHRGSWQHKRPACGFCFMHPCAAVGPGTIFTTEQSQTYSQHDPAYMQPTGQADTFFACAWRANRFRSSARASRTARFCLLCVVTSRHAWMYSPSSTSSRCVLSRGSRPRSRIFFKPFTYLRQAPR